MRAFSLLVCALLLTLAQAAGAREPVVTLRATVTGNQEQPRVMVILPWQAPGATEFEYLPTQSLADDLFQRLDRAEYVRELKYREALNAATAGDRTQVPVNRE